MTGQCEETGWYQIELNGEGYIHHHLDFTLGVDHDPLHLLKTILDSRTR